MTQQFAKTELPISVMVVEDEPLSKLLLSKSLSSAGFRVVGTATNGSDAMRIFREHKPQVALLDINLGDGPTGLDIAAALRKNSLHIGILFVTSLTDVRVLKPNLPHAPLTSAYINKAELSDISNLIEHVRKAFELANIDSTTSGKLVPLKITSEPFTDLQIELMRMISQGLSNAAIADARFTTVKSVENAISRLAKKLNIANDESSNQRVLIAKKFYKLGV